METKVAYSYSRVSTNNQAVSGAGIARQTQMFEGWLAVHPEYVAGDAIVDDGLSGFKGHNLRENAGLGSFLSKAKANDLPKGCCLVIEALDRLSRQDASAARELVNKILDAGVSIAIIKFNTILYTKSKLSLTSDILLTAAFHLAHLEATQRSDRNKAVAEHHVKKARSEGFKIKKTCTFWMELSEDRDEFVFIPEKVKLIERMISMKLSGIGCQTIAKTFNDEGIPPQTKNTRFTSAAISNWLKNPCLSGKLKVNNGDPVDGYFPRLISDHKYDSIQSTFRKTSSGRNAEFANLFRSIIRCPCCDETLYLHTNGKKLDDNGAIRYRHLRCTSHSRAGKTACTLKSISYGKLEPILIQLFAAFDYSLIHPSDDRLADKIEAKEDEYEAAKHHLDDLDGEYMSEGKARRARIRPKMDMLEEEVEQLGDELIDLRKQARSPISKVPDLDLSDMDGRATYNNFLRTNIEWIKPSRERVSIKFRQTDDVVSFNTNLTVELGEWVLEDFCIEKPN